MNVKYPKYLSIFQPINDCVKFWKDTINSTNDTGQVL